MAKTVWSDFLQNFPFWLFDIAPIDAVSFPVLTPLFGFNTITSPEIVLETQDIKEGNYFFTRKVIKGASVSNITLTRGCAFYDSDFWRWTRAALEGNTQLGSSASLGSSLIPIHAQVGGPTPRRTLVLVHFFSKNPFTDNKIALAVSGVAAVGGLAGVLGATTATGVGQSGLAAGLFAGATIGAGAAISAGLKAKGVGPFEFAGRLPAKAWVLAGCLPKRYKAASNFDAKSSEVSIAELELVLEVVEEVALLS